MQITVAAEKIEKNEMLKRLENFRKHVVEIQKIKMPEAERNKIIDIIVNGYFGTEEMPISNKSTVSIK